MSKSSIAAKLYTIFLLLALATTTSALTTVHYTRQSVALLNQLESAPTGVQNVERAKNLATLKQDQRTIFWFSAVLSPVAVLLLIVGAVAVRRSIMRPLAEITTASEQIASGEHLPVPYLERDNEVGALARAIEVLREALQRTSLLTATARAEAEERDVRTQRVESAVDDFRHSVEQALASVSAHSQTMRDTAESLNGIATRASNEAVSATGASQETAENVSTVAAAAEELASSVAEIAQQIAHANQIIRSAGAATETSASEMESLAVAGQRIGAVIGLIQAIAEQTNLLALNATIEAARAGEAGRGFAVVAQEVKSLAGQTAKATQEIGEHVVGIQTSTTTAVNAIRGLAASMQEVTQTTGAIAAAIEEQGAATQEISRNAQMAATGTSTLRSSIGSVSGAIIETNRSAESVLAVASSVSSETSRLSDQVRRFLDQLSDPKQAS